MIDRALGSSCAAVGAMPGILFQSTNERSDPMLENVAHNWSFLSSSFSLFAVMFYLDFKGWLDIAETTFTFHFSIFDAKESI